MSPRRRLGADGEELELAFQARVVGLFRVYGFERIYHAPQGGHRGRVSREQLPEGKGFPDLVAVRPGRLVVAELKRSAAAVRSSQRDQPEQRAWLEAFAAVDDVVEAYLWTPADWDDIHDTIRAGQPRRRDLDPPELLAALAAHPWDIED